MATSCCRLDDHPGDRAAAPVVGAARDRPGAQRPAWHARRRGQLSHVEAGCVTLEAEGALLVVPPHRATWVPVETPHAVSRPGRAAFRGVLVDPGASGRLPPRTTVVAVGPLVRKLIGDASRIPREEAGTPAGWRLAHVLLNRLRSVPAAAALRPPACRDERIRSAVEALICDPLDPRPASAWAASVALGRHGSARRFRAAMGSSPTR